MEAGGTLRMAHEKIVYRKWAEQPGRVEGRAAQIADGRHSTGERKASFHQRLLRMQTSEQVL